MEQQLDFARWVAVQEAAGYTVEHHVPGAAALASRLGVTEQAAGRALAAADPFATALVVGVPPGPAYDDKPGG